MQLNSEKLQILDHDGDSLVVANPGTGKTLLLAHKYVRLLKSGVKPEGILCLTFTDKAKNEMEERILKLAADSELKVETADMNIFTFHAYALENIGEDNIISSNLLRYCIFRYLKDNEVLNYSDDYLISDIVPGMEGHISYLKSFGVTPDKINLEEVKAQLTEKEKYTKEELDKFAEYFLQIYTYYENTKKGKGIDYSDMLIRFLLLKKTPIFEYVLIDELQDVNDMEVNIALRSGKNFFAVGDKKQAIFGFQGGSILNFTKFDKSKKFILGNNYRSSNEILDYAKNYFLSKTTNKDHSSELEALKNPEATSGRKPEIYAVGKDQIVLAACELAKQLLDEGREVAIITRTNYQIMRVSQELKNKEIEHSTTYFSGSEETKGYVIRFLRSFVTDDVNDLRAAMFTPFFPMPIKDAFTLSASKELTAQEVYTKCPAYRKMKESVKNIEDIDRIFEMVVYPVSVTYGKDHLLAAISVQKTFREAVRAIDKMNLENLTAYLNSSDLLTDEGGQRKKVTLTTVHKAKGLEFDAVLYLPSKPRGRTDFQDYVVEAILKTKGVDASEELEEETLRINFVAMTRAKNKLLILTDKPEDYLNQMIEKKTIEVQGKEHADYSEKAKKAYGLFLAGETEGAKELLADKNKWLLDFVTGHFEKLDHLSFSGLRTDPYEYFKDRILGITDFSPALGIGSKVHKMAEHIVKGEVYAIDDDVKTFEQNIKNMVMEIKEHYPEAVGAEIDIDLPLGKLMKTDIEVKFRGKIDAVFKKGDEHMLVDWKTDKNADRASEHRRQLEIYKRAYSVMTGIAPEKIKVAVGFVGLRGRINMGRVDSDLDDSQPKGKVFETFEKHANVVLNWKKEPELLLKDLVETENDEVLWRSIVEQYRKETS